MASSSSSSSYVDWWREVRRHSPEVDNVWMACTNAAFVLPASVALAHADALTTAAVLFAAVASFAYHLVECHKHGMRGVGRGGRRSSHAWLWVDRTGVALLTVRLLVLYADTHGDRFVFSAAHCALGAVAFVLLGVSEHDHSPRTRERYLLAHAGWHVTAALCTDIVLRQYIYVPTYE